MSMKRGISIGTIGTGRLLRTFTCSPDSGSVQYPSRSSVPLLPILGRSLRDLANVAREIDETGANLKVLEQWVDTSTAAGRAFFGMLAVFAAFETDVRRERQMEGIAMAKRRGHLHRQEGNP
jgi:hypothetical protein